MGGFPPLKPPHRTRENGTSNCKPSVGSRIQPAHFLHRWWTFKLRYENGVRPLADIVDDAHTLAMNRLREYEVLAAFSAFTKRKDNMPAGWLDAAAVSQWLKSRNFDVKDIRQKGGVSIRILARDPNAAIESIRERLESMAARVRVGSNRQFALLPTAWIDGEAKRIPACP